MNSKSHDETARPVVFLGPSLPHGEAKKFLEADYRPPIRRGDLVSLQSGTVVGIVDGVFDQNLAVSPREVRTAVARGVKLFGSSSMGALRATEVPGVVGVGRVYEMFRSGTLEDDDEVAIVFDPDTLRPMCEPMVNIRYAVERLVTPGTISRETGRAILRAAKSLPYRERTYPLILRTANLWTGPQAKQLANMLASFDLKREDAITLLERLPKNGVAQSSVSATTDVLTDEDDRQDDEAATARFSPEAPVLFWEFDAPVPFREIVGFLACTGELALHARNAVGRFVLQGNSVEADLSDGPSAEEVASRLLDLVGAQWGFLTDEETRITLGDLGIGAHSFEERMDEEIETQRRVMALVRDGTDEFLDALRVELFLADLALKRATVRWASLKRLAARGGTSTPEERQSAMNKVCELLDARDRGEAVRQLAWWGVDEQQLGAFVDLLTRARRAATEIEKAKRLANQQPVRGLRLFRRSLKPKGEGRFSASLPEALKETKRLCKVVGITRVSIITGLGELGIPNAQAFRPDGNWSSTVGSGKSETPTGARIGAVMEEVEKWTQEQYPRPEQSKQDVTGSYAELRKRRLSAVDPTTLDLPYDSGYQPNQPMSWTPCQDLISGRSMLVPNAALTMHRVPNDIFFSARSGRKEFSTNGLASGFNLEDATCHALCEYVERHNDLIYEVIGSNPGNRSPPSTRVIDPATVPASTKRLIKKVTRGGRFVQLLDIAEDVRIPTFLCGIIQEMAADETIFGVTHNTAYGKASHPNPEVAVNMALAEASQSVMTTIAGAREDLTLRARSLGRHERTRTITRRGFAVRSGGVELPLTPFDSVKGLASKDAREDVRWAVERVRDAGYPMVLMREMTVPEIRPARVVRVIVPGLQTVNPFFTSLEVRRRLLEDLLPRTANR